MHSFLLKPDRLRFAHHVLDRLPRGREGQKDNHQAIHAIAAVLDLEAVTTWASGRWRPVAGFRSKLLFQSPGRRLRESHVNDQ